MSQRRSRSRSPHQFERGSKVLSIYNLPRHWDFDRVKAFIRENTSASRNLRFVDPLKKDGVSTGGFTAKFQSFEGANIALKDLNHLKVDGKTIKVAYHEGPTYQAPNNKQFGDNFKRRHQNINMPNHLQADQQHSEESCETYGLSVNYLNSLGINPPLSNKIFVYNLDDKVDDETIKEVFGMAGNIVNFLLIRKDDSKKEHMKIVAKIEYDHPVEAVQAVAMFQNQELFDKKILLRLDYIMKGPIRKMPNGLKSVGPALGNNGEPMRNVRQLLEVQYLKQEIERLKSTLNPNGSTTNNQQVANSNIPGQMANMTNQIANVTGQMPNDQLSLQNQLMSSLSANMNMNAFNSGAMMNPMMLNQNNMANMAAWAGMVQNPLSVMANQAVSNSGQINAWKTSDNPAMMNQSIATQSLPAQAIAGQGITQPIANQAVGQSHQPNYNGNNQNQDYSGGSNANWSQQHNYDRRSGSDNIDRVFTDDNMDLTDQRREEDDRRRGTGSDMLVFNYLPPSVSLVTLQQKMQEIGEVKFVEMTGQGRAIVRFQSVRDADHCIKMYDRSRVDGQLIEVRYF